MADVRFDGLDGYEQMLAKLGDNSDEVFSKMVTAGVKVAFAAIKGRAGQFAKYVHVKGARKNQYGHFAQVQFKGKTSSGAPAALAVNVYEHGRPGQPARPWLSATCVSTEPNVVVAMQEVYDTEVAKLGNA